MAKLSASGERRMASGWKGLFPSHEKGARGRRNGAFTLVEMLLVIAILGLLAALIGPQIAKQFQKSQVQTTKAQMENLATAIESFYTDTGRYPTEAEGLKVLIDKPDGVSGWSGPYLKKKTLPKDGWGGEFIYKLDAEFGFRIRSWGADKREGGAPGSQDADLDNRL
ncbi:MAG: type II secretion system major pseudopilin GspG [Phycisphaerales bacterium]